jgi:hypothetical protein
MGLLTASANVWNYSEIKNAPILPLHPREYASAECEMNRNLRGTGCCWMHLKSMLHGLDDLRLVPHNDPHVLRLKQHLRTKIRELEQKLSTESCRKAAA